MAESARSAAFEAADANAIEAWIAVLEDGTEQRSDELGTFDRVTIARCRSVTVRVQGRGEFTVACVPAQGERIRLFTRRAIRINGPRASEVAINMPVLEVSRPAPDGGRAWSRLYVHPDHGPIFSTLDLNL